MEAQSAGSGNPRGAVCCCCVDQVPQWVWQHSCAPKIPREGGHQLAEGQMQFMRPLRAVWQCDVYQVRLPAQEMQ
eukprot:14492616-Alexandrium_andersonii.AAC.1